MAVQEYRHISAAITDAQNKIKRRYKGEEKSLITPWQKYNKVHLDGIEWGQFQVISAMSGGGKTLFMGQLYRELHKLNPYEDFAIVLYNFEMSGSRLIIRDAIANTGFSKEKLMSASGMRMDKEDLHKLSEFFDGGTYKQPIFLVEKPCTPQDYIETNKAIYETYGKKVLAISDHSLLFRGESEIERKILVDLSSSIMQQKNEDWSTHILLTQLNREIEDPSRRNACSALNYPDKRCIFGSDALYQAADTVLAMHRPYVLKFVGNTYGPDKLPTSPADLYFHFLKLRDGDPTIAHMIADFKHMKILDGNMFT